MKKINISKYVTIFFGVVTGFLAFGSMLVTTLFVMFLALVSLLLMAIAGAFYLWHYSYQALYERVFKKKPPSTLGQLMEQEGDVLQTLKALASPAIADARMSEFLRRSSAQPATKVGLALYHASKPQETFEVSYAEARRAAIFFGFNDIPEEPESIANFDYLLPRKIA